MAESGVDLFLVQPDLKRWHAMPERRSFQRTGRAFGVEVACVFPLLDILSDAAEESRQSDHLLGHFELTGLDAVDGDRRIDIRLKIDRNGMLSAASATRSPGGCLGTRDRRAVRGAKGVTCCNAREPLGSPPTPDSGYSFAEVGRTSQCWRTLSPPSTCWTRTRS